jgi:hypothetical protein
MVGSREGKAFGNAALETFKIPFAVAWKVLSRMVDETL